MATALKDIQFNKPVLVGEANANNGTTYALGSYDVIGPIAKGTITLPDSGCAQAMWGFDGFAEYAKSALSAHWAAEADVANHATGAGALDFGDGARSIGSVSVGLLPTLSLGSPSGSWSVLCNYLDNLTTALQDIQSKSIVVVSNS